MVCFQSILCGEASTNRLPGIRPAGYASHTGYQYDSISRVAGHRELAPPSKFSKLGGLNSNVFIHQAFVILSVVQCQSPKFCALCGLPGSTQPVCVLLLRHYSSVPDLVAEPNHNSTVFRMPIRCLGTWWRCGVPALLLRDFELGIGLRSLEPFKDCFDPVFMFR